MAGMSNFNSNSTNTYLKKPEAKKMGADNATSDRDTFKKLKGYFDLLINTISVEIDMNKYPKLLAVDGVIVDVALAEKELFTSK
jgi:alcohol dehydrogenase (NADP+)